MATAAAITAAVGPLVGRRREVAQLRELLEKARLVTVTGAGGSGKTRVALEVVASLDGEAAFVQLAPVRDPSLVAAAIAQELGLGGTGAEEALVEALGPRRLLLCLDNFEHVVDAAPLVSRLLAAAPELCVLVTSQTALRVSGEQEFPLAPLEAGEAVEFFTVCARRFQPAFAPDEAVTEICRRLDGLPLALELAAARVKLMSPAQILDRLERRLPLLTGGMRDVPERHRTLRAAIDWSYQLLTLEEQQLFARLSVFPGGCTLDEADAVGEEGVDALEHVASLVDKSLLRRQDGSDEPRFRMLETLRDYAQERLEEEGVADAVRARQAAYYAQLAEQSEGEMLGPRYPYWLDVVRAELDNVEAVVDWGFEHAPEAVLRIVAAWGSRLFTVAPARVAPLLERSIDLLPEAPPSLSAGVLRTVGFVRLVMRDLERAAELLGAAVAIYMELGRLADVARSRALLAAAWGHMQRADEAIEALDLAVAEARAAGDDSILVLVLANVGSAASGLGEVERARAALEEAVTLAERIGAVTPLFVARINLGSVLLRDDPERAASFFRAALDGAVSTADTQVLHVLEGLAMSALLTGDVEGARQQLIELVDNARQVGRPAQVHSALTGLMGVASATGDHATAARLAGAAHAFNSSVGRASYLERFADDSRTALGDPEWERLVAEGAAMSVDDAVDTMLDRPGGHEAAVVRRAFLFTDIVSSTQLLELIGDSAWENLVSWHDRTLRALFAVHGGEEVDHAGDGFFVAFAGAGEAVACAVAVQRSLAEHRRTNGFAPEVRIGVHEAEASSAGSGYRGLGVHTAARIGATAHGGEIVASAATARSAAAPTLGEPHEVALKGLAEPVPLVRLSWRDSSL